MRKVLHSSLDRRHGSVWKPFLFYFLEISFFMLVLSFLEFNPDPSTWSNVSYAALSVWMCYITWKLFRVLGRQSSDKIKHSQ